MIDKLRESMGDGPYFQDDEQSDRPSKPSKGERRGLLGMTAFHRFVLVLLVFAVIFALGTFVLVVTGRIVLPL
jgi:hypothetical protein